METIGQSAGLRPLLTELRLNDRLRWMVFAIFAIFLAYLALVLDDWRADRVAAYRPLALREARLRELDQNTEVDFKAYYEREREANRALKQQFWRSTSQGLAGAELQSWLRGLAREHNVEKPRFDLSDGRPVQGFDQPVWRLEAELSGEIKPGDARGLVASLAQSERKVLVEQFSFAPRRGDRLTLRLVANFLIEDSQGGQGG
jgi:hypothetical protein